MDFLGFMVVSVQNMVQSLLFKINLEEITMSHLTFLTKKKQQKDLPIFYKVTSYHWITVNTLKLVESYTTDVETLN